MASVIARRINSFLKPIFDYLQVSSQQELVVSAGVDIDTVDTFLKNRNMNFNTQVFTMAKAFLMDVKTNNSSIASAKISIDPTTKSLKIMFHSVGDLFVGELDIAAVYERGVLVNKLVQQQQQAEKI